jgi:hypothetical protein
VVIVSILDFEESIIGAFKNNVHNIRNVALVIQCVYIRSVLEVL